MSLQESITEQTSEVFHAILKQLPSTQGMKERIATIGLSIALAMGVGGCEKDTSTENAQSTEKPTKVAQKNPRFGHGSSREKTTEKDHNNQCTKLE